MPVIKIKEIEEQSFAAFDVTENTVLIPMLYVRSTYKDSEGVEHYEELEAKAATLYTNVQAFRNDLSGHRVEVDGNYDKSYVMAYELLLQGLNVVIKPIKYDNIVEGNSITLDKAYEILEEAIANGALDEFKNRNIFNIKFVTTGGYANCGYKYSSYIDSEGEEHALYTISYIKLRELAKDRGDAIALIEYQEYFKDEEALFEKINSTTVNSEADYFAAAFFPWASYTSTATGTVLEVTMPACFGYLMAYSASIKNNANWFAASGVNRGYIPNLKSPQFEIGEALMHILQGDNQDTSLTFMINPIYNAGSYGYRIWGNKIFSKDSSIYEERYINFLNVRVLMCDIKKQIYHSAMRVSFEPNDDIVWITFKTLANSLLDRMKSGRGLRWYHWTKEVAEEKATIKAILTIQPIEAVESFDFTIILTDEEASVQETV